MDKMIVNWVKEDEELIEPYEWCEGDDIEIISSIQCIRVDQKTMYDFIYGCLNICDRNFYNKVFAIGDGYHALAIETNQEGRLCYRSVFDFKDRKRINDLILKQREIKLNYQMYDEGEMKEYGLTREERIKKQFIEQKIDEVYIDHYDDFLKLCEKLNTQDEKSIQKYYHLKKLIEKGYSFIHALLYHEFNKKEYKKK